MMLLESLEAATKRNAPKIYGEVAGFGIASDAFHALRPTDSGVGLIKAIQSAMIEAGIQPREIDVFNCHATSTQKGDASEAKCMSSILAVENINTISAKSISELKTPPLTQPLITANKSNLGHGVAAACAWESVLAMMTLHT
jgi:3-oxoacyl-(acyl-carrier-protein) synthase